MPRALSMHPALGIRAGYGRLPGFFPSCFLPASMPEFLTGNPMPVSASTFVHRQNADGKIDSICVRCITVIASGQWEAELERAESEHRCNPNRLDELRDMMLDSRYPK